MTIKIENLTREFDGFKAVDNLSLEIRPGEIVGLLGANGAGKTTALKVLSGFLAESAGSVEVGGLNYSNSRKEIRSNIGFLTKGMQLYEKMTVRENLLFFGRLRNMSESQLKTSIDYFIVKLEMSDFIDKRFVELSSGQKQRSLITATLLHDPDILILDEITAELDIVSSQFIMDLLREQRSKNKTILFSTHIISEAELLCDRVAIINKGQLKELETIDNLKIKYGYDSLARIFLAIINNEFNKNSSLDLEKAA